MDEPHVRYARASAWKIFPLGIVMGLVALSPLLWYLVDPPGEEGISSMIYLVGAFSVVLGCLGILLVFLWIGEWATQESQRED